MTKNTIELLDLVKHRNVKVDTSIIDVEHNHLNTVFVTVRELATLIHEYPIFITKNPNTGQFLLNALLGIESGENLFIKDNQWRARYLPLDILRRPFQAMLTKEDDLSNGHIAIDTANPLIQTKQGEPLFDENGKASPYLERVQQTFAELMAGTQQTNKILDLMYQYDLLEPVNLTINVETEQEKSINGLYTVNKENLNNLAGESLENCHNNGVLQVCYLILSSGAHVEKLMRWSNEN